MRKGSGVVSVPSIIADKNAAQTSFTTKMSPKHLAAAVGGLGLVATKNIKRLPDDDYGNGVYISTLGKVYVYQTWTNSWVNCGYRKISEGEAALFEPLAKLHDIHHFGNSAPAGRILVSLTRGGVHGVTSSGDLAGLYGGES